MRTIRRLFIAAAFTVFLPIRPQKLWTAKTPDPHEAVHASSRSPSPQVRAAPAQNTITLYTEKLPRIPHLSSRDDVFKQYGADVEENYKRSAAGKIKHAQFYAYTPTADDTLFIIAAACSIP